MSNYNFELVLQVRDSFGNPTGKTKSFSTDKSDELNEFYIHNSHKKVREPKKDVDGKIIPRKPKKEKESTSKETTFEKFMAKKAKLPEKEE